jgi:exopolyphosphatase/guanosine-5'-triphosphate,3'-diphosphate pyrophosphatase
MMNDLVGVMDLGTNTFHLLVARVKKGSFEVVHRERQAVKIGKGGINNSEILPEAVDRALSCMSGFRNKLDELGVLRFRAIGTSAFRSASNSADVVHQIKTTTGIEVQVISGDQEATYIYQGIRAALALGSASGLIVDIGGGSVEFIIANDSSVFWQVSVDIGAQRLLEQFHRHDPMTSKEYAGLMEHYDTSLAPVLEAAKRWMPTTLVGSSGTFDTLSEIYCLSMGVPYTASSPETPLTPEAFQIIHRELLARNRDDRMKIPGMIEMRVDMIVVASCLIHYLLSKLVFDRIRVSSYSLKEGVLAELANG